MVDLFLIEEEMLLAKKSVVFREIENLTCSELFLCIFLSMKMVGMRVKMGIVHSIDWKKVIGVIICFGIQKCNNMSKGCLLLGVDSGRKKTLSRRVGNMLKFSEFYYLLTEIYKASIS